MVLYFLSQSLQFISSVCRLIISLLVWFIEPFLSEPSLSNVFFRLVSKNQIGALTPAIILDPWSWTSLEVPWQWMVTVARTLRDVPRTITDFKEECGVKENVVVVERYSGVCAVDGDIIEHEGSGLIRRLIC